MIITETELKVFQMNAECTQCHSGIYYCISRQDYWNAGVNPVKTIKAIHKCNKCGFEEILDREYPYIFYKKVDKNADVA